MLRNSRPSAGQLRFAPLMRDEKRFCLRLLTVEKESSLIFCRKYLMPSSKEWRPGEVLGLGLAISKAIIESHGGKIYASSKGRRLGATFTIELKTAQDETAPISAT